MKVLIIGQFHHKNKEGLEYMLTYLKFQYKWGNYNDIPNYDVIFMPTNPIDTSKYPTKKFIFGNHFSVFPNKKLLYINNIHKNCCYIQPSKWVCDLWKNLAAEKYIPIRLLSFSVNTNKFKPIINSKKDNVLIYFKRRKQEELDYLKNFLKFKHINFEVFDYVKRYQEENYLKVLQKAKYGIILDAHESQGFAIEEALSCNVPLLVWDVSTLNQEEGVTFPDFPATSIPYWDNRCGEYFYKKEEFEEKYNKFISKLETYKPREFVLENLSVEKCSENLKNILS